MTNFFNIFRLNKEACEDQNASLVPVVTSLQVNKLTNTINFSTDLKIETITFVNVLHTSEYINKSRKFYDVGLFPATADRSNLLEPLKMHTLV